MNLYSQYNNIKIYYMYKMHKNKIIYNYLQAYIHKKNKQNLDKKQNKLS